MKNLFLTLLLLFSFVAGLSAQVVTTNPTIVTQESGVIEVIFDATKGTAGLKGYTGDIYAHTGVITTKSTSSSDWKYVKAAWNVNIPACKMISLGNDQWKLVITPDIRSYYGITDASEAVKQLAFVFRSSDGTKEGKDTGGKDIFVDVYKPGLNVVFTSPAEEATFIEAGNSIPVSIQASQSTTIKCLVNGSLVKEVQNASELTFSQLFATAGDHEVIAEAGAAPDIARDTIKVIVRSAIANETRPAGTRTGINITNDQTVTLCLYAPFKNFVYLIGDFNNWQVSNNYLMKKDGDYWWLTLPSVTAGQEYAFQYLVDGNLRIADPYTDKVLDPWNDSGIPSSVYPNLKPYPSGKTEGIVSVFQTAQQPYNWSIKNFQPVAKEKLVIYELLIRDFVDEHSFKAVAGKLDYLKAMGVNAVELMPVNEFEGNNSWGYNPSFYFAVDKYYGTKNDYKAFIDECHKRGMAVIMDMVLNHSYGQSPFVQLYWNKTNNTPAANNPWYNVTSPNATYSWGYDFNHESAQTKALVDSVNSYWMKEYNIDGFRFDFTKGFTQKAGDGWAYDASRIAILKRMRSEIQKRKPDAIVIFEHLTENSEEVELADDNILLWGNMNDAYCQSSMGYSDRSDLSGSIYSKRGFHQPNLLAYMESHDEERMMYKNREYGNSNSTYNVKYLNVALERAKLSACFYLSTPGPKMIWQFGELGYDYSINYCEDGTVNNECRLTPKPVRWNYASDPARKAIYDIYSNLNYLKANYPTFSTTDFTYTLTGLLKSFVWKNADMNAFAIGNFDVKQGTVSVVLPHAGKWYEVFSGNEIEVPSTTYTTNLQPGIYQLYTDKKVTIPTGIEAVRTDKTSFRIYPNPVTNILYISANGERPVPASRDRMANEAVVLDLSGRVVIRSANTERVEVSGLTKGVYLLQLNNEVLKFIKK